MHLWHTHAPWQQYLADAILLYVGVSRRWEKFSDFVSMFVKAKEATGPDALLDKARIGRGVEKLHGTAAVDVDHHTSTLWHVCSVCIKHLYRRGVNNKTGDVVVDALPP